jgi:hypothetical protein
VEKKQRGKKNTFYCSGEETKRKKNTFYCSGEGIKRKEKHVLLQWRRNKEERKTTQAGKTAYSLFVSSTMPGAVHLLNVGNVLHHII